MSGYWRGKPPIFLIVSVPGTLQSHSFLMLSPMPDGADVPVITGCFKLAGQGHRVGGFWKQSG